MIWIWVLDLILINGVRSLMQLLPIEYLQPSILPHINCLLMVLILDWCILFLIYYNWYFVLVFFKGVKYGKWFKNQLLNFKWYNVLKNLFLVRKIIWFLIIFKVLYIHAIVPVFQSFQSFISEVKYMYLILL